MNTNLVQETVVVESVAASGKGIKANGVWYNRGKGASFATFLGLQKGDTVTLDTNEVGGKKWVMGLTISGVPSSNASPNVSSTGAGMTVNNTGSTIARQAAFKAVLGSPLVAALFKDKPADEALGLVKELVVQMTNYALTGKFTPEV